jgi:glycerophosphoryl diester phosphodiesterase
LNVEVKYPDLSEAISHHLHMHPLNMYVDAILQTCIDHDRPMIFSSFHPETLIFLRAKQDKYPVLFLTDGQPSPSPDPRSQSLHAAIEFAHSFGLDGIVTWITPLLACPHAIKECHDRGLLIMTYGSDNTQPDICHFQKEWGVDGIITDDLIMARKGLGT